MVEIKFDSGYLGSDRGVTKIAQIVLGFVACSVLCSNGYFGSSCFGEGRIGYASGLNSVVLIINIVVFFLNVCNIKFLRLEYLYSVICVVLFIISSAMILWYQIEWSSWGVWMIVALVSNVIIFITFTWDAQATRVSGEHLPI